MHALLHVAGQAQAFNRATNQPKAASGQPDRALYRQPNGPLVCRTPQTISPHAASARETSRTPQPRGLGVAQAQSLHGSTSPPDPSLVSCCRGGPSHQPTLPPPPREFATAASPSHGGKRSASASLGCVRMILRLKSDPTSPRAVLAPLHSGIFWWVSPGILGDKHWFHLTGKLGTTDCF
jgi:hypothetical protein